MGKYTVEKTQDEKFSQWVVMDMEWLLPDFYSTVWIGKKTAETTQKKYCYELKKYLNWAEKAQFELETNLAKGVILTATQVSDLANAVGYDGVPLQVDTFNSSMTTIASYLEWRATEYRSGLHIDSPVRRRLDTDEEVLRFKANIEDEVTRYSKSNPSRHSDVNKEKGHSLQEINRIECYLSPESIQREFTEQFGPKLARRNWLIVNLFYFYGLRASELGLLKTTEHTFPKPDDANKGQLIRVYPDLTPENDERKNKPGFKTKPRELPAQDELMRQISAYIVNDRPRLSKQARITGSDYLFITCQGQMSYSAIKDVVKTFLKGIAKVGNHNPHSLRHTCASNFQRRLSGMFSANGLKPEQQQAFTQMLLSYWFGWSTSPAKGSPFGATSTAAKYTASAMRDKLKEVSLEHQRSVVSKILEDVPF